MKCQCNKRKDKCPDKAYGKNNLCSFCQEHCNLLDEGFGLYNPEKEKYPPYDSV